MSSAFALTVTLYKHMYIQECAVDACGTSSVCLSGFPRLLRRWYLLLCSYGESERQIAKRSVNTSEWFSAAGISPGPSCQSGGWGVGVRGERPATGRRRWKIDQGGRCLFKVRSQFWGEGGTSSSPSHLQTIFFFFLLLFGERCWRREWSRAEAAGSLSTNALILSHSSFSNIFLPPEYFGEWLFPPTTTYHFLFFFSFPLLQRSRSPAEVFFKHL